jgi:hypothetical protein
MQKTLLFLIFLLLLTKITAQKTEFSIALNSGLLAFSGASAEKTTSIYLDFGNTHSTGYTNNPYGAKFGLGYSVSTNLKRITKDNIVIGFGLAYETLRSKISIDRIDFYGNTTNIPNTASGQTYLRLNCLNFNPQLGYRFHFNKLTFDIVGGFDIGYILRANEKGRAVDSDGIIYTTARDRKTINVDFHTNTQFCVYYRKIGFSLGFAQGFRNYRAGFSGGTNECYARLIRFGLAYRLN